MEQLTHTHTHTDAANCCVHLSASVNVRVCFMMPFKGERRNVGRFPQRPPRLAVCVRTFLHLNNSRFLCFSHTGKRLWFIFPWASGIYGLVVKFYNYSINKWERKAQDGEMRVESRPVRLSTRPPGGSVFKCVYVSEYYSWEALKSDSMPGVNCVLFFFFPLYETFKNPIRSLSSSRKTIWSFGNYILNVS